jgi:aspartyl-tRNA(Asn)/glutamyl-tRNA(Gln) amidotransferase subunit A
MLRVAALGLQVVGRHFSEPLLLDLALTVERNRPWPLTTLAADHGARLVAG